MMRGGEGEDEDEDKEQNAGKRRPHPQGKAKAATGALRQMAQDTELSPPKMCYKEKAERKKWSEMKVKEKESGRCC